VAAEPAAATTSILLENLLLLSLESKNFKAQPDFAKVGANNF
jgi:hypothetical protein